MRNNRQTAGTSLPRPLASRFARRLWPIAVVAGLAGCQAAPPAPQSAATPAPTGVETAPPPAAPAVLAAASTLRAASILGLDRGALRKLLGEPGLIRHDAPAEVWQYRTETCVLDLVLYKQANRSRVVYAEARTPSATPASTDGCLGDVAAARKSLSSS
jgi:hypothetical protein